MRVQNISVSLVGRAFMIALFALASFAFSVKPVAAQGFLIDPIRPRPLPRIMPPRPAPETPYSIQSEEIVASISGSVAQVNVSQTFKNEGSSTIETSFVFPLPYDGAIDSMTLLVDGKELPAELVDADEARKQYEEIVRKARDPALLEWVGNGLFKTSVFPIPAGESRTVSMRYTQLLRVSDGLSEFLFPLGAAKYSSKPIKKIKFEVSISCDSEIKNIYSPTYDVSVERPSKTTATVTSVLENRVPSADFRLFYDQSPDDLSAKIISYRPDVEEDGYFLLLATPKIAADDVKPLPRTIVFCLDDSGSMMGNKIAQARDSLKFVISRLREGDKFNIVLFNSDVVSFKEELQPLTEETRQEALAYVDAVRARGGTNIADALKRSFSLLNEGDSENPRYLIFVSDGAPTVNETNEMKLVQIARENNKKNARVFTFGVGYDVHARLLDHLVRDGRGQGEYVKPEENIEDRVSAFYSHIDAPIFSEVEFNFTLKNHTDQKFFVNQVYPSGKTDLFAGEQLVLVGRCSESGPVQISAKGKIGERDEEKTFEGTLTSKSEDSTNAFVERIWAMRRIGEIIDELDLKGENQELFDELVALSKKHGVMTPYTAFLAREDVDLNATAVNNVAAERAFSSMASSMGGVSGVSQRNAKQQFRNLSNISGERADMALSESRTALSAAPAYGGGGTAMGGGRGGGRGGFRLLAKPRDIGMNGAMGAVARDSAALDDSLSEELDDTNPEEAVRNVGTKTFYLRKGRWIDSSITKEQEENDTPIVVKQFSDEYFKLVEEYGQDLAQYLVFEESVTLNFNNQLYNIERADE